MAQETVSEEIEEQVDSLEVTSRRDIRALAFHFLYAIDRYEYKIPLEKVVAQFERGFDLKIDSDSYALTLVHGVLDNRKKLDELIKPQLKNWSIERLGICTLLILRLALWELSQPEAIASVIINEAVELAKCFAEKDAFRFVNGVLDNLSRFDDSAGLL